MSPRPASSAPAPVATDPAKIRNVVLVGRSGSGKSTLFDHLIADTTTEYRPRSAPVERSVQMSLAALAVDDLVVNLIDTPGYADFVGELRAGLRAADAAVFVVSAADGLDAATAMLWHECAAVNMPRAVVVTRLDAQRADVDGTIESCHEQLGAGVLPLYTPVHAADGSVTGTVGILSRKLYDYHSGDRTVSDIDEATTAEIDGARSELMEAIITESEDDSLLDRYLSGEEIDLDVVIADLLTAVAKGTLYPLVPVSVDTKVGIKELWELISRAFPPPTLHPLPNITTVHGVALEPMRCDASEPLVAEVVRTASDAYVGRLSVVRVFRGTLTPDTPVHISGHWSAFAGREIAGHPDHDDDERVGALSSPLGDNLRPRGPAVAGDLCVVAKLTQAETSDTLSAKDTPVLIEPWVLPEPLLPVAVQPHSKSDEDKLAGALARLTAEDPTLRLEHNQETHQVVLWTMGQAHIDMVMTRLGDRFGVTVDTEDVKVPLRETFVATAQGHGRHVKQSGGHGQYAVCDITVEPLPRGSGFEFVDKVVGGSVPRQFIPSVEKGVRAQLELGCLAGFPMVDVRVTLFDGKAHSVDSSDMAFQTAGALALKAAASEQTVSLLEPVDRVRVEVADEYLGAVLGDLQTRRVRVNGTESAGDGRTAILADVPQSEMIRYAVDLRSVSHGTGTFGRESGGYEAIPAHLVKDYLSA